MSATKHGKGEKKSKSRKEVRKANRIAKKSRKNDFHSGRKLKDAPKKEKIQESVTKKLDYTPKTKKVQTLSSKEIMNKQIIQQKAQLKKLQRQMEKQRVETLKDNNDDDIIEKLERKLKLNKRKSKSIPKSFVEDGLNYILEVCDSENMEGVVSAETQFAEMDDEFEEDLALMTGKASKRSKNKSEFSDDDSEDMGSDDEDFNTNASEEDDSKFGEHEEGSDEEDFDEEEFSDIGDSSDDEDQSNLNPSSRKRKIDDTETKAKKVRFDIQTKKQKLDKSVESDDDIISGDDYDGAEEEEEDDAISSENQKAEVWEDIYGRLRGKGGELLEEEKETYIPPARRAKMEGGAANNQKNAKLLALEKQLKGPMNKLGEGNMHKIATQIEGLYMNNSRNDMSETLTSLIFKSIIAEVLTNEKSVIEHALLITILHANIGTEIGAQFLQNCVKRFEELFEEATLPENKKLDNVVRIIAHLYNFKLFHVKLMYEILNKLSSQFTETNIECILLILQSIGFIMRKDDPLAMKDFILDLQQKANSASNDVKNDDRVKFMLDLLLAVKNNNTSKIKNYDTSHSDHLKKLMKGFIRKGCYVTTLNISMEDLLNADENGKWWVVGSAWLGKTNTVEQEQKPSSVKGFSQQILDLAKAQKMNTDLRRNIFCVIMSAEDYLDAFGNLLQLGLSNHQEREIVHIIIYCALHEKVFNPFYAHLAQKFCEYDRRFMMMMKYSIWDRLKALTKCSAFQLSNLAKLLTHLFLRKCLPITTLKVVNFVELDKITLKFIRQILIGILVCDDEETCKGVFVNIAQSEELRMFKESLKIFIQLFLSKNLNSKVIEEDQKKLLSERSKMIERVLSFNSKKAMF